jgi:hypothetical protein
VGRWELIEIDFPETDGKGRGPFAEGAQEGGGRSCPVSATPTPLATRLGDHAPNQPLPLGRAPHVIRHIGVLGSDQLARWLQPSRECGNRSNSNYAQGFIANDADIRPIRPAN